MNDAYTFIRDAHKTFRRRPEFLLNVLCTFNLRPLCRGQAMTS